MSNWVPWERSDEAKGKGLFTDPVVRRIAEDPTEVRDLVVLVGLLGKAPKEGVWRLYLDYALSEFYEIAEADIVYVRSADGERSRVWVTAGAQLRHVARTILRAGEPGGTGLALRRGQARPAETFFLQGPIVEGDWGAGAGFEDDGGPQPTGTGCARCPGT